MEYGTAPREQFIKLHLGATLDCETPQSVARGCWAHQRPSYHP